MKDIKDTLALCEKFALEGRKKIWGSYFFLYCI